jgi:DNA (cytosine-5)-methyltransferase 1
MDKKMMTAIDLFAGCGGFSLGLLQAGFKVLVAVENDRWAAETYRYNLHGIKVLEEDIKGITTQRLLKESGLLKGQLDLLVGGPPCQGFSTANRWRSLKDPRSRLMYEFIRLNKGIQPRYFMIENVPGLFAYKDFFIMLMDTLEKTGYDVRCLMMDAVSYGVPQFRRRIFIHGTRSDLKTLPVFPPPTHFSPEQISQPKKSSFQRAAVAVKCFAVNGFPKEEVKDLYWNTKLSIMMNRRTAERVFDIATGELIAEGIKRSLAVKYKPGE